jgi:hypothetical protein
VNRQHGRRRSDRQGWPLADRLRYRRARAAATVREWSNVILLVAVLLAVALAAVSLVQARGASDRSSGSADSATRAAENAARAAKEAAQSARTQLQADARAVERDAARTFQRCEQIEPVAIIVQLAVDTAPALREQIRRRHPEVLDAKGHLPVPDCKRIYPLGAAVSGRYPDLTPTKPAP